MSARDPHWTCWRCKGSTGRHARSVLCTDCHARLSADGLRWCPRGRHVVAVTAFGTHTYCQACRRTYNAQFRAHDNEQRRARYHTDPEFRARRRQDAAAYWPYRRRKIQIIGRNRARRGIVEGV